MVRVVCMGEVTFRVQNSRAGGGGGWSANLVFGGKVFVFSWMADVEIFPGAVTGNLGEVEAASVTELGVAGSF